MMPNDDATIEDSKDGCPMNGQGDAAAELAALRGRLEAVAARALATMDARSSRQAEKDAAHKEWKRFRALIDGPTPTDQQPDPTWAEVITTLRQLNSQFYWMCFKAKVGANAHAFIEFNGLMSKYVDLLARAAEQGIDPHLINEHSGVSLPCEGHDMAYLGEKLRCIFGPVLDSNPEAKAALKRAMFGREQAMAKEKTDDPRVKKALDELDAYGHLTWCVGFNSEDDSADWLACFDFDVVRDEDGKRWVVYHTVVNSDSGGFIGTLESCIVEIDKAPFGLPDYWAGISQDGHGEQWTDADIAEAAKINAEWNLALKECVDNPDSDTIYCDESCEGCEICYESQDPVADGWVGRDGRP